MYRFGIYLYYYTGVGEQYAPLEGVSVNIKDGGEDFEYVGNGLYQTQNSWYNAPDAAMQIPDYPVRIEVSDYEGYVPVGDGYLDSVYAYDDADGCTYSLFFNIDSQPGTPPTFNASSLTATCSPTSATTSNAVTTTTGFTAATAGHGGTITYSIQSVDGGSASGWSLNASTRKITIPANKPGGVTYSVVVRATESAYGNYTSSYTDATISVTLNKRNPTLTVTSNTVSVVYPNSVTVTNWVTGGTYYGALSVASGNTTRATATISGTNVTVITENATAVGAVTINVTSAATNFDNAKTTGKSVTTSKGTDSGPTFNNASVSATLAPTNATTSPAVNCGAFTAATAAHSGGLTYAIQSVNGGAVGSWTMTSGTSRVIKVPASTAGGQTFSIVVRATEAATTVMNAGTKDATITVTVNKANIPAVTVNMTGYTYGGTKNNPSLSATPASGGTVTYYYNTSNSNSGGTAWSTVTDATSLNAGTYYMYAVVAATNYYNEYTTATKSFVISQATGAAPTWSPTLTKSVTLAPTSATVSPYRNVGQFEVATANHGGALSYQLISVTNQAHAGQNVTGWTLGGSTGKTSSRYIRVPASTPGAQVFSVTVRAYEAATTNYTESYTDATFTITVNKANQRPTLTIASTGSSYTNNTGTSTVTYPNGDTYTVSGYYGTLNSVTSGTTTVATCTNAAASTITSVGAGSSRITFSIGETDYSKSATIYATITVQRRTGAAPTFDSDELDATLAPTAPTVSPAIGVIFPAATAGHGGTISYTLVSVVRNSDSTTLSGWSVTSNTRTINIPASTPGDDDYGYSVTVRATEGQTSTDTSSTEDATFTLFLHKKAQTAPTATGTSAEYATSGSISGSASGGTGAGTLYYKSDANGGTSYGTATINAPSRNKNSIGTTTFVAYWSGNDYWNASSNSNQASLVITKRTGAAPTFSPSNLSVTLAPTTATNSPAVNCGAFTAATAGHSGTLSYSIVSVKNGSNNVSGWTLTTPTSRIINVPASTVGGIGYTVVLRATEAPTSTDTESYKDATITVTVNKKAQTAPTATGATNTYSTGGSVSGSASGGGGVGTITYRSDTAGGTNYGTATTTAPSRARSSVGTTTFIAYWPGNNYWAQSPNSNQASLIVNKASITPTVSCSNLTYGGNTATATVSAGNPGSGTITWSSSNTNVATVNSTTGVVTPVGAGSVRITATVAETANYLGGTGYKDITVSKATPGFHLLGQELTYPSAATITARASVVGTIYYGTSASTMTSTAAVTTPSTSSHNVTLHTQSNAGSTTLYAYFVPTDTDNYNSVGSAGNPDQTATATTNKGTGGVTISNANPTYGTSNNLATVSGATGTMYYRVGTSGNFSTTMPTASGRNAGSYTLYYYVAESTNYTAFGTSSSPKSLTVTVAKASNQITVSPTSVTVYYRTGYTNATVTVSNYKGTVTAESSNTGKITVSPASSTSGTFTVSGVAAGSATITFTDTSTNYATSTATCSVTCAQDTVSSVDVSVGTKSLSYGGTTSITATAHYASGYSPNVTSSATYTASPSGKVEVKPGATVTGIYIDDLPSYHYIHDESDGYGIREFTMYLDLDDDNYYTPSGTITYGGQTRYLWVNSTPLDRRYIVTASNDPATLISQSVQYNLNNWYTISVIATLNPDQQTYETPTAREGKRIVMVVVG